jgi:hypothetical protein
MAELALVWLLPISLAQVVAWFRFVLLVMVSSFTEQMSFCLAWFRWHGA